MQKKESKKSEKKIESNLESAKQEFEAIKKIEVKNTRTVRLFHHCNGNEFTLEVPTDSKFKDGDMLSDHQLPGEKPTGRNMYSLGDKPDHRTNGYPTGNNKHYGSQYTKGKDY